jgi:hypothetical protein
MSQKRRSSSSLLVLSQIVSSAGTLNPSPSQQELESNQEQLLSRLGLPSVKEENVRKKKKSSKRSILVPDTPEEPVDRTLYYIEFEAGRKIRRKVDFNSPRTTKAAAQIGLTFDDCIKK